GDQVTVTFAARGFPLRSSCTNLGSTNRRRRKIWRRCAEPEASETTGDPCPRRRAKAITRPGPGTLALTTTEPSGLRFALTHGGRGRWLVMVKVVLVVCVVVVCGATGVRWATNASATPLASPKIRLSAVETKHTRLASLDSESAPLTEPSASPPPPLVTT